MPVKIKKIKFVTAEEESVKSSSSSELKLVEEELPSEHSQEI